MTEPLGPIRVLVVDDQNLFRTGLVALLQADPRVKVVGQARNGAEAVRKSRLLNAEVVLMDIRMPEMDGIEATRRILAAHPEVKILILSAMEGDAFVLQALAAGAQGYILKDADAEAVVSSIRAVIAGEQVMTGAIGRRVFELAAGDPHVAAGDHGLSRRELAILKLIGTGLAGKQVAQQLGLSEKTVRNNLSRIYHKLGVFDRSGAVLYAIRTGIADA